MSGQTQKSDNSKFIGLLLFSGTDRAGTASEIFAALSPFSIKILDLEEILISDRTIFTIQIELDPAHADVLESDLQLIATKLDLDFAAHFSNFTHFQSNATSAKMILVGDFFTPKALSALTSVITKNGANITRISKIITDPFLAIEFVIKIEAQKLPELRKEIAAVGREHKTAVTVLDNNANSYGRKLLICDVDSTLIAEEVIDLLAIKANVGDEVAAITAAAMRGELDFKESLTKRVQLLAGLDASALTEIRKDIHLTPGVKNLVTQMLVRGHLVAAVSGGFVDVIEDLMQEIGITKYRANKLEIQDGKLTGKLTGKIIDSHAKAETLIDLANEAEIALSNTIAIGDGANDFEMLKVAGTGIAFNAKPVLHQVADIVLNVTNLDSVLYLLGITSLEINGN